MARPIQGLRTHVSDMNSSPACTTALKNIRETLGLFTLLSQNPLHPRTSLLRLPKATHYRRRFVVRHRQDPPQIFEGGTLIEWFYIGLIVPLQNLLQLQFQHPSSLSINPLGALSGDEMPLIRRPPGRHYVAPGSPWVGEVDLLQYNHGIPEILV